MPCGRLKSCSDSHPREDCTFLKTLRRRGCLDPFDHEKYPLWTALITPFETDGGIDRNSLKNLIKEQETASNALLLLGSTGEALNMSTNDKMRVLSIAFETASRVPVMVGIGGINLSATLEWLEYLEKLPVDAYLSVVPPYVRPGKVGQTEWFKALLDRSSRPVMIYNVPSRTGCALSLDALKSLGSHPRLQAVKEAGGSTEDFKHYAQTAPSLTFYSGDDPLFPELVSLGARGLISVASNVWPQETRSYCRAALAGKLSPHDTTLWRESTSLLFHAGNPVTVKHLLREIGRIESPRCLPPLSSREEIQIRNLLDAHEKIRHWYQR